MPDIPDAGQILATEGITKLTPLQMNGVTFDKRHTLLTPDALEQIPKQ